MAATRRGWNAPVHRASETEDQRQRLPATLDAETPDPYAGERKWPIWAVSIGVIAFCAAFWVGVGAILTALFG